MNQINYIAKYHSDLTAWRHDIHAHPETAFEEKRTAEFIAKKLTQFGLEVHTGIAETGIVACLTNGSGKSIGLRADMDALDITESNDFSHKSKIPGKMHACGHDGHSAMLLGAARYLAETRNFKGTVHFIFQPAEENEGGGRVMVETGLFERFPMDAVFGLHNWPGMAVGQMGIRPGTIMAAYDIFEIEVIGRGSHAAMPHLGTDPILIASEIVISLQKLVSRRVNPIDSAVLSVTQIHGGETYNIIPDRVFLRGTIRSFRPEIQEMMEDTLRQTVTGICSATGATCKVNYEKRYPPTVNSEKETDFAATVAAEIVGKENVITNLLPSMGSEDFSFMLQKKPGAYMRIGNGSAANGRILHSPDYDFNDEILPIGAAYFARLSEKFLSGDGHSTPPVFGN